VRSQAPSESNTWLTSRVTRAAMRRGAARGVTVKLAKVRSESATGDRGYSPHLNGTEA
jgi:hypothetical protein